MAGTSIQGRNCKVALGANSVIGMGNWNMDGITIDQYDDTELGDSWKSYEFGQRDGGQVTFNGLYKLGEVTGQDALRRAMLADPPTDLTDLRLYINNTSYYEPCQSTGYWSPGAYSTGMNTILSHCNVTAFNVGVDKAGLGTCSFTLKVSGLMVLV